MQSVNSILIKVSSWVPQKNYFGFIIKFKYSFTSECVWGTSARASVEGHWKVFSQK
jgi:hypothetical protein